MICSKCNIDKGPEDYYYHNGKLSGRKCKKCRIKQNSQYSKKVYKRKTNRIYNTKQQIEEMQEEKENLELRIELIQKLFPTGIIPIKFRQRYL